MQIKMDLFPKKKKEDKEMTEQEKTDLKKVFDVLIPVLGIALTVKLIYKLGYNKGVKDYCNLLKATCDAMTISDILVK